MKHLQRLFERYPILRGCEADLTSALAILTTAYETGNKLLVCGNGGSAADSEHIVAELMKGFLKPRRISDSDAACLTENAGALGTTIAGKLQTALPAISLVSQIALISAVANDTSAEMVFAQQVYGLGKPGDVLLGITTSGNSKNVINAVVVAKSFGLKTIILTGRSGGTVAPLADTTIRVPADEVADIQELHLRGLPLAVHRTGRKVLRLTTDSAAESRFARNHNKLPSEKSPTDRKLQVKLQEDTRILAFLDHRVWKKSVDGFHEFEATIR